jgi:hypothetical protein
MPINVSEYINQLAASDPGIASNVRKGVKASTAFFQAAESGNFNVSQILDTSNLSAQDQANLNAFNNAVGSLGTLPNLQFPSLGAAGAASANLAAKLGSGAKTTSEAQSKNKGIEEASKLSFDNGAGRDVLDSADAPTGVALLKIKTEIPILLQSEVRALMVQLGYMASDWSVDYVQPPKYGRYAVHNTTLINYGYKDSKTGNWTGKDGIKTEVDFLFDNNVQDRIMQRFIVDQYQALIKCDAIRNGDGKPTVGGLIAASYFFQDAKPSLAAGAQAVGDLLGTLSIGDPTSLVGSAADLTGQLTQSLGFNGQSAVSGLPAKLDNVLADATAVAGSIPGAVSTGSLTDLGTLVQSKSVAASATAAVKSTQQALSDLVETTKTAAKADVSKFNQAASDFASSLPALAVKNWRNTGNGGAAEYFNAGKYAVQTLAADIGT